MKLELQDVLDLINSIADYDKPWESVELKRNSDRVLHVTFFDVESNKLGTQVFPRPIA
jgi:hypothetical protein